MNTEKYPKQYPDEGPCRWCGAEANYVAISAFVLPGMLYGKQDWRLLCAEHATQAALGDDPPRQIMPLPKTARRVKLKFTQEAWDL